MSAVAATVSLGLSGWANGDQKVADVVAHLYIGGSGAWTFHRLSDEEAEYRWIRMSSHGAASFWTDVSAGFSLCMRAAAGLPDVPLEPAGSGELVVDDHMRNLLSRRVSDLNVAATVAIVDPALQEGARDLAVVPNWSVALATVNFDRRWSRWSGAGA